MRSVFFKWFVFTILLVSPSQLLASAANTLVLEKNQYLLSEHNMWMYEDENNNLSIEEIRHSNKFKPLTDDNPHYGFGSGAVWLKIKFNNQSDYTKWVVDLSFAQNDYVDFYLYVGELQIDHVAAGKLAQNSQYRYPTMRLEIGSEEYSLYVKLVNRAGRIAPLHLSEESYFEKQQYLEGIFWGVFYGGLGLLLLYNLALSTIWKESNVKSYAFYVFSVLLFEVVWSGHIQLFNLPTINAWFLKYPDMVFGLTALAAATFTVNFLNSRVTAPLVHKIILFISGCLATVMLITLTDSLDSSLTSDAIYGLSLLSAIIFSIAAVESYSNKFLPAKYFIFAWGILVLAAVAGMLSLIEVLPSNTYTAYCFQVAVVIEASLFSLGISQKMRLALEDEVEAATDELRNNLEFIEIQNAELHIARKNALQASKIKSQFLANMSHEIRTPLNAIVGFSKELRKSALSSTEQESAEIIASSAQHLVNVVNDILDVSKIEAGKIEIENAPFNFSDLTQELVSIYAPQAFSKYVELIFEYQLQRQQWSGDAFRIRQVITNLLSNAIKFTDSGMVTLKVYQQENQMIVIEVEDTGIGMNEQQQRKVFDAFAQADNSTTRKYGGTGLGLVICRELCHMMGGDVAISSEDNQGTIIRARIKLTPTTTEETSGESLKQKTLLICDELTPAEDALIGAAQTLGSKVLTLEDDWHSADIDALLVSYNEVVAQRQYFTQLNTLNITKFALVAPNFPDEKIPHGWQRLEKPVGGNKLLDHLLHKEKSVDLTVGSGQSNDLSGFSILVADDMPLNLRLIDYWMKDTQAKVCKAENGIEAVAQASLQKFDLILMDVQMPEMDGLEATVKIREDSLNTDTPIIAVTAHAFKEEQERMYAVGMNEMLSKPLDEDIFMSTIKKWRKADNSSKESAPKETSLHDSIDWQYSLAHANQNEEIARDIFKMFINKLPQHVDEILQSYYAKETQSLLQRVHKFHGACCYTGVPKLRALCNQLESILKRQPDADIDSLINALADEAGRLPKLADELFAA